MSNVQSQVPDAGTPIFDVGGYINPVWHQFFFTLLRRTGGSEGVDSGSEAERITVVEKRVEATEQEIESVVPIYLPPYQPHPEVIASQRQMSPMELQVAPAHGVHYDPALHAVASQVDNGFMASADKAKLDGITAGAQPNVATNLGIGTRTTTTVPITSSTGTSANFPIATTALAGALSSADKTKLDSVATGATAVQILGTVSQTGGVPTGAILERGSNANGDWVKMADGTMICSFQSATLTTTSTGVGALFVGFPAVMTFSQAFISPPKVMPIVGKDASSVGQTWGYPSNLAPSSTTYGMGILSPVTGATGYGGYVAYGRWF